MSIQELKSKHKLLKVWEYSWKPLFRGYTDKVLYINPGTLEIKDKDVSPSVKEKFIGGKGLVSGCSGTQHVLKQNGMILKTK